MSKHILMIADVNSFWTRQYIESCLLPQGWSVTIFPIWGNKGAYTQRYREQGVRVYQDNHRLPVIRYIPRLRMWARIWLNARALRKLGPFDVIHNHYLSRRDLALGEAIARRFPATRWVCSFWGSDLLRAAPKQLAEMGPYLRRCHAITVQSALHTQMLQNTFGTAVAQKAALVQFGIAALSEIQRVQKTMTQAQCKAHFGIGEGQRVVCVGANANPAQRQDRVLEALAHLPAQELAAITLVLQMTWGGHDQAYIQAVKEKAEALPCQHVFLWEFLNETETAKLRLAADVFIFAIQTDAFSGSLREYLYAGARVIAGDWLPYPQLEALGIELTRFADYPEIPALLVKLLGEALPPEEKERRDQIQSLYSWEAVRADWLATYERGPGQ